jgi:hypothetical protein
MYMNSLQAGTLYCDFNTHRVFCVFGDQAFPGCAFPGMSKKTIGLGDMVAVGND